MEGKMIHTQKVAISMPEILVKEIDALIEKKGMSRSRYITQAVSEKIKTDKKSIIKENLPNLTIKILAAGKIGFPGL